MAEDEEINWSVDLQINLFQAMRKHKPVGVNRHFQMMYIHKTLNESVSRKISAKQIWKQLGTFYDLQALNESEIIPFPNGPTDFVLPEQEFKDAREKSFPRMMKDNPITMQEDITKDTVKEPATKENIKEHSKETTVPKSKSSITDKALERVTETSKSDDSPKREQRKRTRQTQQSPATDTTPSSSATKRARRT